MMGLTDAAHVSRLSRLASIHFDVTLPTSSVTLKKAYRRRCLELHPDVGGDAAEFKEMKAAYDELMKMGSLLEVIEGEEEYADAQVEPVTTDGKPLANLGLGLGPQVNGTDCPECGHKGYIPRHEVLMKPCSVCRGTGEAPLTEPCRACKGTGKFTQERSRRVVSCRVCGGTGQFKKSPQRRGFFSLFRVPCVHCRGRGEVPTVGRKIVTYQTCHRCGGTGELPVWNPVLRKGALK